jgi:two-component system LytT family response regulator
VNPLVRSVLIADDEPLARERIRLLLEPHRGFKVVDETGTGDEALAAIRRLHPDVVFLDIRMPGRNGVEVAQELLSDERPPAVVFVTAHDEFAIRAFEVSAIDYLVKPIDRERFDQMLGRVERRVMGDALSGVARSELLMLLDSLRDGPGQRARFVVRTAKGHYFIKVEDVESAVAQGNYLSLTAGGRTHLVRETMKSFEESVSRNEFVRIHRSVIVRIDAIARVVATGSGEYRLTMKNGGRFDSSRAYSERVRALLR